MDTVQIRFSLTDDLSGGMKKMLIPIEDFQNAIKGAVSATEKAKTVFGKITDSLIKIQTAAQSVSHVGETLNQVTAPAIDFQQRMADLSAITGVTGDELDRVAGMARRIGKESGLGASEAARAFSVLAGQLDAPIDDIGQILEKSATLAQAAGLTIDDAANSLAATISQYGLAAQDADRVMNVLAAGSRAGASEVVDLAQSFKVVGAAASSLGVDVEHTAGALEVLGGANIKGAEAGTALRNVLLSLKTKLGIDTSVTDLSDALTALQPKLQDTEFLAKTFGIENVTAATYLIQNADAVREMTEAVTETQAAQEQAEIRNATWAHSLEVMRATIDDVKIGIGSSLGDFGALSQILVENASSITSVVELSSMLSNGFVYLKTKLISLSEWVSKTTIAQKISAVVMKAWAATTSFASRCTAAVTTRLGAMRAAIMRTTAAQRIAAVATRAWAAVQTVLNVIMSMNPIGLIIMGIGLLVAAVYGVIEAFKRWGDEALMLFGPLGSMILAFKTHWDSIVEAFKSGGIIAGLKRIGEVLMDALLRPVQKLLGWVAELTGWDWAKKAAEWVHEVRIDHNLVSEEEKKREIDPATGKPVAEKNADKTSPVGSPLGINAATGTTASKATAQSSQIKRIDITIDKVVENFTVSTTNLRHGASDIRDMVARALVDAVNDVNYAL